jgi:hypothetical protein
VTTTLFNAAESFGLTEGGMTGQSPLVRRNYSPLRKAAIAEAARLWERVWQHGDPRAAVTVLENFATNDLFKAATGDVLDQELLTRYNELPTQWGSFAARTTVRNFKPKRLVDILGGRVALDAVPEFGPYPGAKYDTSERTISVAKFGRRFGFSWEASINDDLDELMTIPGSYAAAARATEDREANEQIFDVATGAPNTSFFRAATAAEAKLGRPNTAPSALPLTQDNLQTAITTVSTRKNGEGEIIAPDGLILMVGPALQITAENILNTTEVRITDGAKTITTTNPVRGKVELVVNRRLPGNAWFVLPKPATARPAAAVAFLRGWETPDLRIKADAGNRLGGGAVDPTEGSFDDDSVAYRVRHVVGAATGDPLHTFASTG